MTAAKAQNPTAAFANRPTALRTFETPHAAISPQQLRANANLSLSGLATGAAGVSGGDSKPVNQHAQAPIPAAQPHLENAPSAMLQLFQKHDIVMFGEVHNSRQEYEWLCKLVKTPGFSDHVDDIVVEFGNALDQKIVDRYVAGEAVPFEEVQKAWRDMVADAQPVSPVYGWL